MKEGYKFPERLPEYKDLFNSAIYKTFLFIWLFAWLVMIVAVFVAIWAPFTDALKLFLSGFVTWIISTVVTRTLFYFFKKHVTYWQDMKAVYDSLNGEEKEDFAREMNELFESVKK